MHFYVEEYIARSNQKKREQLRKANEKLKKINGQENSSDNGILLKKAN
jgi:hypothetical protein